MARKYQMDIHLLTNSVMSQIDPDSRKYANPLENPRLTLMAEACNMSATGMLQNLIMKKKKDLLAMHKTPITFDKKTGRWWTRLPDGGHPSNKNKSDLEDRIVAYYLKETEPQVNSLTSIYDGFMAGRAHMNANTRAKDTHIWETYFKDSTFADMELKSITRQDIRDFLTETIVSHGMKKRYFKNVQSFLNLMLTYALDKELIAINKMTSIKFRNDLFAPDEKHGADEDALDTGEIQQLIQAAEADFTDTGNPAALGICITLLTGVRVGELCGMKFSDFNANRQEVTLSRMLIAKRSTDDVRKMDGFEIVDGLKKGVPERTLYIDTDVLDYISKIRNKNLELGYPAGNDDYVFWRNNHNTNHETVICTNRTFDSLLRTYCRRCGFKYVYSMHDIRRTYISTLDKNSVPLKDVQRQAGHSTIEMTMRYLRSVSTKDEQRMQFDRAFTSLKKHKGTDEADGGKER